MGEFSDSYHLWGSDVDTAVRLVLATGRFGVVVPPAKCHVPFFVESVDRAGGPMDEVLEHNPGTLLHYAFGEDHGCLIQVFERAEALATLSFVDAGERRPDRRATSRNAENTEEALAVLRDRGVLTAAQAMRLMEIARTAAVHESGPQVAAALDLEQVSWTSCADLSYQSQRELRQRYPGARFVNTKQRGKAKSAPSLDELMALPIPVVDLDASQERLVERHYKYWTEFGDYDEEAQQGFWMLEHYNSLLPRRYRYLTTQLMNYNYRDPDALRRVLCAIVALCEAQDWEQLLRGF
jgi:hypothetical protein